MTIVQPSGIGPRLQVVVEIGVAVGVDEVIVGMSTLTVITTSAAVLLRSRWVLDQFSSLGSLRRRKKHSDPLPASFELHVGRGIWESGALRAHS